MCNPFKGCLSIKVYQINVQFLTITLLAMSIRVSILSASLALFSVVCLSAQTTVTRSLSAFDEVAISGGFDVVELKAGDAEMVKLDLSGIDPDRIITEVEGNTLRIGVKKGNYHDFKGKVYVTYRNLKAVANSGSSNVVAASTIKGDKFEYSSSGSGDFKATFDVKKLEVSISGSSDMTLSGNADRQEYAISGSGDIKANALKGKEAAVAISGSGDVSLNVDGPVRTAVSGSGQVNNNK